MTVLSLRADRHALGRTLDALEAVLEPGVNLAVWERALPPDVGRWLDALCARATLDAGAVVALASLDASPLLADAPPGPARDWWQRDVEALIARFAALAGVDHVEAHLGTVAHDKCRKLHADHVGLRLLCTYSGPGTRWLPESAAVRAALVPSNDGPDEANARVAPDLDLVRSLRAGDVGVLKGDAWPGNHGHGAIHQSAPIAARGLRRLLLKLDAPGATRGH